MLHSLSPRDPFSLAVDFLCSSVELAEVGDLILFLVKLVFAVLLLQSLAMPQLEQLDSVHLPAAHSKPPLPHTKQQHISPFDLDSSTAASSAMSGCADTPPSSLIFSMWSRKNPATFRRGLPYLSMFSHC